MHGDLLTAILWSVIPAILLLAAIYYLDRFEKEPGRLILIALGAGAVVAPVATAWIEKAFDVPNTVATSQAIIVPAFVNANQAIIVSIVLGVVMLGVFYIVRHEIDDLLDGLVYGAVVGVGFGLAANFWTIWTTPDILGGPLRNGPPSAFRLRLLLAATMVPSYGVYGGFELCENEPASPANEEYLHSEKYEIKHRDWQRSDSLSPFMTRLNEIRRGHP